MYRDAFHRRLVSRRRLIAGGGAAALGVGAASLAGCGGGEEKGATATAGTAAAQPKRGGHLQVYSTGATSVPLDPVTGGAYGTRTAVGSVYSRIWKIKSGAGVDPWAGTLEPDLALSLEQPDKTTYIYKLRPGVKWQDKPPLNGRAFTADDVVYSVRRALDEPKSTITGNFSTISAVRAIDPQTVQFQLNTPYVPFNVKLSGTITIYITPREIEQNLADTAIGTGPFILDSRTPSVSLTYSRNPSYYGLPEQPYVDRYTLTDIADSSAAEAAFTTGKIDQYSVQDRRSFERLKQAVSDLQSLAYDSGGNYFYFRCDRPPFQDVRMRQAYALTVDYDGLIQAFTSGDGRVNTLVPQAMKQWSVPPSQWGDGAKYHSKPDIAEAKKLMQAAGYGDGVDYDFYYSTVFNAYAPFIQAMAAGAEKAGFRAKFHVEEYAVYGLRIAGKSEYSGMLHLPNTTTQFDPDIYIYDYLYPGAFRYAAYQKDPELDALILKQRQEFDTEARKKVIADIERRNLAQNYFLPTIATKVYGVWQKRLQNYSPVSGDVPVWAATAWLQV